MKQLEGFKDRLARHLLQPAYGRWATFVVIALLASVAFGKPVYTAVERQDQQRWTKVVVVEAQTKSSAGVDAAQDFGRELDILTSFYETVISILLGVIAVVAGLAFWTIKVVSKNQAEETAQDAAEKIIGNHDGFANKLKDAVSREIGDRLEEVQTKIEELEERAGGGEDEHVITVESAKPQPVRKRARATRKSPRKVESNKE